MITNPCMFVIDMTEVKTTWNKHDVKVIKMVSDEGKFTLNGTSVLLKRGDWGLLCNWIDTDRGGCFEIMPVEILPDGTVKEIAQYNKDWRGGIDIWSQGHNLFAWREGFDIPKTYAPLRENDTNDDSRRPKLLVFIPPEGIDTDEPADDSTTKAISKGNPKVY